MKLQTKKNKTGVYQLALKSLNNSNLIFQFKKFSSITENNTTNNSDKQSFVEMDENLLYRTLNDMNKDKLKKLCKENNLRRYSKLTKRDLVSLLTTHFLTIQAESLKVTPLEATTHKLPIIQNKQNQINISIWFQITNKRLSRWLESKNFNALLDEHCEVNNKTKENAIIKGADGQLYVDLTLALITAAQFSPKLYYSVFKFYIDHFDHQEAVILSLTHQLQLLQRGISLEIMEKWETFDFYFAYYMFEIDNVVNCGIVGRPDSRNVLSARLRTHRNTYVRLILINVFQFNDSQSVAAFETLMKATLKPYSIGKNDLLEQYEVKNQNTAEVINGIVTKTFNVMKEANEGIGSMCPEEQINNYNQSVRNRTT